MSGFEQLERLVVVAAHPDDETLGAGLISADLAGQGWEVEVVILTRGENSHPGSPTTTAEERAAMRARESAIAARLLSPSIRLHPASFADGGLATEHDALVTTIVDIVGDGRRTLLLAPWRHDGHSDHEAAGWAAAAAAVRTGAILAEYPVWMWHWAEPEEFPYASARRWSTNATVREQKAAAIAAHRSQIAPLSSEPGDEVLLDGAFLEHFGGADEYFILDQPFDDALDRLHADDDDPWGLDDRWYEHRKAQLLLACLPRERYGRALEVGCSRGSLSTLLSRRAGRVLAVDASEHAVALARERVPSSVDVAHLRVPDEWPEDRFDLIVVSELGYFLSPVALERLWVTIAASLEPDGTVVLCHWRGEVRGWPLDGPQVHASAEKSGELPPVQARYRDDDVEILVMTREWIATDA
ncbi:PIG-L family deacetylase [Aeromicrobium sp. PE09-221]|uniref:PIG-L family deacetylase n=1 Tax=Aeromicrobium sp. PE09-221 TaxID=1898043 RepID=UPI001121053F|nr:PIG-L family deacetylase [Aeromicrobium sp. PE09-221]